MEEAKSYGTSVLLKHAEAVAIGGHLHLLDSYSTFLFYSLSIVYVNIIVSILYLTLSHGQSQPVSTSVGEARARAEQTVARFGDRSGPTIRAWGARSDPQSTGLTGGVNLLG